MGNVYLKPNEVKRIQDLLDAEQKLAKLKAAVEALDILNPSFGTDGFIHPSGATDFDCIYCDQVNVHELNCPVTKLREVWKVLEDEDTKTK